MKLEVSIDLTDIWCEENNTLSDMLKSEIVWQVQQAVWAEFSDEAKTEFSSKVRALLDNAKNGRIDSIIDDCFNNEKIRKSVYDAKTEVTMKEYVIQSLKHQTVSNFQFNNKIDETIKNQAADIVKQLKERYDMLFASQIVSRLNEAGMLKDDVARLLLQNSEANKEGAGNG